MPTYDYKCEANGQIIEVQHPMSDEVVCWADLCALAGIEPGDTPLTAQVTRLPTGGNVLKSRMSSEPPCQSGGECPGKACGFNG